MATIHSFEAARQAKDAQTLRFPDFPPSKPASKRRTSQKALRIAAKRAAVRQAGKAWL